MAAILSIKNLNFDSLWPKDAIWRHTSGSTLAQVMACCLMTPSHCLNQWWHIIKYVLCHSPGSSFTKTAHELNRQHVFGDYTFRNTKIFSLGPVRYNHMQYMSMIMHFVHGLLCFVVVWYWLILPYLSTFVQWFETIHSTKPTMFLSWTIINKYGTKLSDNNGRTRSIKDTFVVALYSHQNSLWDTLLLHTSMA